MSFDVVLNILPWLRLSHSPLLRVAESINDKHLRKCPSYARPYARKSAQMGCFLVKKVILDASKELVVTRHVFYDAV